MDESLHELEEELAALTPRSPSRPLQERIAGDLAGAKSRPSERPRYTSATNLNSWKWSAWRVTGCAACLALVGWVAFSSLEFGSKPGMARSETRGGAVASQTLPDAGYRPVSASNVLYDLKDEGAVTLEGDTRARRLRYRYLDTYTWKSSRGNASLKWSVPRDEIRVLPASLN